MKKVKQFFLRHFIVAPVSFGTFFFLLLGTGMNLFAATGILIAMYLGGTFGIKQLQIGSAVKELGMTRSEYKHIQFQLEEAKKKVKKLGSLYGQVRSVQAFRQVYELSSLSRKVMTIVRNDPKKFYQTEQFFYAHLDSAVELTSKYALLSNQQLKDKEVRIALQHTRETITDVTRQLEDDLQDALATDLAALQLELDYVDVTMRRRKELPTTEEELLDDRKQANDR
ncbi:MULTISPECIES: 5-bromo-4-chloroindolyl phosphate hydrolysis family protein [Sporosarcina]|uniref:5-bromo-4-chloroindolyl phosphate hydrolysis family protein n=1 Tax=Sporosarcina TaxID=1569 RepID=UPI00058F192E|nr:MULTISPECIES: 5-bromo-4-chloroindolyl phosphate hydrolysis family protein [Sporosarcina]WJY28250.1 5-bromo-4-chloroindolyl phosphate hydrolysis family protein [Sporosarcina sp. 0.2-SM1T-5]